MKQFGTRTKYSEVLPDTSLTPPPNIVVEVLWICGVEERVLSREDTVPPLRETVVPWVNLVRRAMAVTVKGPGPEFVAYS